MNLRRNAGCAALTCAGAVLLAGALIAAGERAEKALLILLLGVIACLLWMIISTLGSLKTWYCPKCGGLNSGEPRICGECEDPEGKA